MDNRATGSTSFRRISLDIPGRRAATANTMEVYWLLQQQSAGRTRKMDETLPWEQIRTRRAITSPSSLLIRFVRPCDNRAFRNSINNLEGNAWNSYAIICYKNSKQTVQKISTSVVNQKKVEEKWSSGTLVAVMQFCYIYQSSVLFDSATQHDPDRKKDNAKHKTFKHRGTSLQSRLLFLVSPSLRTTGGAGVIKLLNACRAKFLREVQVLIRKLRDFEGQIGELSRTYPSRHIPAVSRCLQAPCPREARFITQQSGRSPY